MYQSSPETVDALHYRDKIALHVGRYILRSTEIDMQLSYLVANYADSLRAQEYRDEIKGRFTKEKIGLLRKVMPETIHDRERFLSHLQSMDLYRDRLAHSSAGPRMDLENISPDADGMYRIDWVFEKERATGGARLLIDSKELQRQEQQQIVMHIATFALLTSTHSNWLLGGTDVAFDSVWRVLDRYGPHGWSMDQYDDVAAITKAARRMFPRPQALPEATA